MNRYTMIVLVMLTSGCAVGHTPKELMEAGSQTTHALKKAPTEATYCMARNIENWRPSAIGAMLHPEVRPMAPGNELIVRASTLELTTIIVAHVLPSGAGSEAKVWMTPNPIIHGRDETLKALIAGC